MKKALGLISVLLVFVTLFSMAVPMHAADDKNDYKLYTAKQLYDIMPAKTGTLSEDGEYIRFTGGDIAFSINDLDQFDPSVYKYMVVGVRASEANGNTVPANAYMWYNDRADFGARFGFTSGYGVCWGWKSKTSIGAGDSFGKLKFTVTDAYRNDGSRDIDYTRGIASLILKPYHSTGMMSEGSTFDIQYIGFFKSEADAESFNIKRYDPEKASVGTPADRGTSRPVIVLKFDDLGSGNVEGFDRIARILKEKGIVGSFGVVGQSIANASPNAPVFAYMKKWAADGIEIWSHGYLHSKAEYSTDSYDTQLANFKKTLDLVKEKAGIEIKSFGSPHNNSQRDTLVMVKDNFPQIKTFFHGFVDDNVSSVYHIRNHCGLETGTGVTDYNAFLINYSYQKYHSHLFIQTHPANWTNADIENFENMLDYLIADGCTFMTPTQAYSDYYVRKPIEVRLVEDYIEFDVKPALINGRTMVPFRKIFEALDAEISFDQTTSTATAKKGGITISVTKDSSTAYVNGNPVTLDSPAIIVDGRFLVPVRFVSESFGCFVHWEASTKTVTILPELGKQTLGAGGIEIVKASYGDYQKTPGMFGEYSFDGSIDTAWYCEGKVNKEITYELKEKTLVGRADVMWYKGDTQATPYEIYTSLDGVSFELAASGTSSGTAAAYEPIAINKEAKFIKVVTGYNGTNYDHGVCEISFSK